MRRDDTHEMRHPHAGAGYFFLLNFSLYICSAVEVDPSSAFAHHAYGQLLNDRGDKESAFSLFKRAVELDSDNPKMLSSMAVALKVRV